MKERPPLLREVRRQSRPRHAARSRAAWSPPLVMVQSHAARPIQPAVDPSKLIVNIAARPYGVRTIVFLNGTRLLGFAPLRVRFDRPGRYRLLFFAPTLGPSGRRYSVIDVTGRSREWIAVRMGPTSEIARSSER